MEPAWLADRALELLSGRAKDQPQQVAVDLVMSDRALLPAAFGGTAPKDDVAYVPGRGPIPGADARARIASWLTGDDAFVWLRRLFADPTGRDLVALDSTRRKFHGGLRRFLELRDPTCRVPWCDAPGIESDHTEPVRAGGQTTATNGQRLCKRHNLVKELDGWHFTVESDGLHTGTGTSAHGIRIVTPTRHTFASTAPPILGEGWSRGTPQHREPEPRIHVDFSFPPTPIDWAA